MHPRAGGGRRGRGGEFASAGPGGGPVDPPPRAARGPCALSRAHPGGTPGHRGDGRGCDAGGGVPQADRPGSAGPCRRHGRAGLRRERAAGPATDRGTKTAAGAAGTNGALVFLLGLRFRGGLRQMRRSVATPKGKLMGGVGAFLVVLWIGSFLLTGSSRGGTPDEAIHAFLPLIILLMLVTGVLRTSSDQAISFSPAEVNFLFGGPFSRRQLLLYRVALLAVASLGLSVFVAVLGAPDLGPTLRILPGIFSAVLLAQLVSLFAAVLRERVGLVLSGRLGWGIGVLVLVLAASGLFGAVGSLDLSDPRGLLEAVRSGPEWRAVELALTPFTLAITAMTPEGLALGLAGATAVNGAVLGAILLLDANYLEAASRKGERRYSDLQRAQSQGIARAKPGRRHRGVPRLPHWGGAGTIAWRQLTALRRGSFGLVLLLLAAGAVGGGWIVRSEPETLVVVVLALLNFPLFLFLADSLRFDFRGDLDALETLKAMPLRPIPLVLGQIAVPTALLTLTALGLTAPPLVAAGYGAALPLVAVLLLLVNALIFGTKNYLFLHFPVSLRGRNPADIRFLGRMVLFLMVEAFIVLAAVGASALCAVIGAAVFLGSLGLVGIKVPTVVFAVTFALAFGAFLCFPVYLMLGRAGRAFENLDPSRLLAD
ncbi:MAG: hypothetical protein EA350_03135 [Gemmatimonadales bacterium]|nr:MAG: hypothetical protein EA350_03135 [Gemmatimonadales bacterium]